MPTPQIARRGLMAGGLLAVWSLAAPANAQNRREIIAAAKELYDALDEAREDYEALDEKSRELAQIAADIQRARSDPDYLDGAKFADLYVRLALLIPDGMPLPDAAKSAVRVATFGIAALIEAATNFSLETVRGRFRRLMQVYTGDTSMTEVEQAWRAARESAPTRQVQQWAFLQWLRSKHGG